ncbi:hypothetical protein Taro_032322 [Colocasia esculenta]|uniref:TOD1/MUCI70 glycosyltransferase-like domain-containing protein n=1 Tax=Colocasia esculenta TaxID=4460 RepID=A0A843W3K3_COLES|nr:hypothetical protein [Colocasia esculenta]
MCLWFNEVVRFTSRDQLSFPYVLRRLNIPGINMFPVCTRKDLVNSMGHRRKHDASVPTPVAAEAGKGSSREVDNSKQVWRSSNEITSFFQLDNVRVSPSPLKSSCALEN